MKTLFNDAWDSVPGCKRLRTFCGGLATVFPNTTSVESDFSILKWELDEFRSSLMHLSVEGVMQAAIVAEATVGVKCACSRMCERSDDDANATCECNMREQSVD